MRIRKRMMKFASKNEWFVIQDNWKNENTFVAARYLNSKKGYICIEVEPIEKSNSTYILTELIFPEKELIENITNYNPNDLDSIKEALKFANEEGYESSFEDYIIKTNKFESTMNNYGINLNSLLDGYQSTEFNKKEEQVFNEEDEEDELPYEEYNDDSFFNYEPTNKNFNKKYIKDVRYAPPQNNKRKQ